jgi:hypothetical protein
MDNALAVRRFEGVGDLPRDAERLVDMERLAANQCVERRPFDELEHQRVDAVGVLDP